jgi:hypothetical protein
VVEEAAVVADFVAEEEVLQVEVEQEEDGRRDEGTLSQNLYRFY